MDINLQAILPTNEIDGHRPLFRCGQYDSVPRRLGHRLPAPQSTSYTDVLDPFRGRSWPIKMNVPNMEMVVSIAT